VGSVAGDLGPNQPKPHPSQTKKSQGNGHGFSWIHLDFFVRFRGFSMGYEHSKGKNFLGPGAGDPLRRKRNSAKIRPAP
jgi:hypothetical protein